MFIVQLTSECAPVAKVGGLADVVYGLSRELEIRGNAVEIVLPKYDVARYDRVYALQEVWRDLIVPWGGGAVHCSVYFGFAEGRKCFFIDSHSRELFFNRHCFYGCSDDDLRFAFFCKAAMEFLLKSNKRPEVIHCHDWQTGLAPVLLYEMYAAAGMGHCRVCYTLHNVKHQGITGPHVLHAAGLHNVGHLMHQDRLGDPYRPGAINLMKGGIVYSNFVTTVSPRYAFEIRHTDQGFGLGHTLYLHQNKFGGVLNGVDYDVWNPEIDPHIPARYNAETIEKKYENKRALRNRLLLRDEFRPIVAYIGRLDPQKGLHLLRHALFRCINGGAQFVLLGTSPDGWIQREFEHLKWEINDNPDSHLELRHDEDLAHLIYAGADLFLVPSLFEPCGLTQMIAMKYGTLPIVREVGGLADTVFDADYDSRPFEQRNGFVFRDFNPQGLDSALDRAIALWYHDPARFRALMLNAMRYDYSWNHPGQHYLAIYDFIRHK